jgi:ABC-type branched-subunit amino acid transport system substrate-binding protein
MNKTSLLLAAGFALLTYGGVALADEARIGVILPLSGPFAQYGAKIQQNLEAGKGPNIKFVFEDEGCDPRIAINAYKKLSEHDGISLFLGPWCGSPQSAVAPQLKFKKQVALLGSSAPSEVFSTSGGRMFSTQHTIEEESTFLAQQITKVGAKRVAIIFRENQFSRAHEAAFRSNFKGEVSETYSYTSDDIAELKAIALKVKGYKPDALYMPDASPLLAGLVKELEAIGVKDPAIYSVYSAQSEGVANVLGASGTRLRYSYPDIGNQDALDYFPKQASILFSQIVESCGRDADCALKELQADQRFNKDGAVNGRFVLKTLRDGRFESIK